LVI
jgi:hypothetical protein